MDILRTIIRFAIILVFLVLLVFLSVTLFKLIPLGINQLATASLSLTGLDKEATTTTTTVIDRTPQYVATTTGGLNGVVTQTVGDIVISEKPTTVKTNTVVKTVYVTKPVYYPAPPVYVPTYTGLKNIKATLISIGIIDRYSGQFVSTNSYTVDDTIVVKYKILNDQDTATGPFTMRVEMPALGYNDRVKIINNINIPGKSSYNVEARFNGLDTSVTPVVRIYTDVNGNVNETNESDNTLSVSLSNVVNNNNNNNCSYYSNGYYYNNCNTNNNNYSNCNQYNQNNTECYDYCTHYNCGGTNQGAPNLIISSIQAGRMVNGSFVIQSSFNYGERIYVRMIVKNTGGTFSTNWATRNSFTDSTGSNRVLTTNSERPLANNEELTVTYEVDSLGRGNTTFNVNIDSFGNVYESNENDNVATLGVYVY